MQDDWSIPESPRGVSQYPSADHRSRKKAASASSTSGSRHGACTKKRSGPRKRVVFLEEGHHDEIDYCSSSSCSDSAVDTPPPLPPVQPPKIKCSYFGLQRPELSKDELHSMYYSKKDFKAFKKDAQKLAQLTEAEEAQALYVRAFLDVYHKSAAVEATSQDDDGSRAEEAKVAVSDRACLPLATAPVRGLERHIFPGLVNDQKQVKKSVLRAQDKIPLSMEPDMRARILASTSILLSRQARHIARTVAHADSIIALSIYRQTFLPQKKDNKKGSGSKNTVASSKDSSTNNKKKKPPE